jgi:hypothetical protein
MLIVFSMLGGLVLGVLIGIALMYSSPPVTMHHYVSAPKAPAPGVDPQPAGELSEDDQLRIAHAALGRALAGHQSRGDMIGMASGGGHHD